MREVSGNALGTLVEALESVGIAIDPWIEGLPITRDELHDTTRRIDWDLFVALCDRAEIACEGVVPLEELGSRILATPSFEFLRRAARLVVTPRQLYDVAGRMLAPALFSNLTVRLTWLAGGRLQITEELAAGYRESRAFFRIAHGNVAALPQLLGLPASTIEEQSISGRRGRVIVLPPPSHTIGTSVVRGIKSIWALGDAFRGIARQQAELDESLDALRTSRHELRQLIERLPEGVLIHSDGAVRWANAAMIELLGYRRVEDIVGKEILTFIVPEERKRIEVEIAKAAPRSVDDELVEYRILRPDGKQRRIEAGTTQHVEFEGAPARLVVVRDVTERHRLREQLALADRMASIGMVAAGVAHEINNPLAYVQLNLEVVSRELAALREPARAAMIAESVRSATEGTERVRAIVRDLKTLSRADDDMLEVVNLPALLDSTLLLAEGALKSKAQIVRRYGPVPSALAGHGRLGQVFLNLLVNAADAIPEGAPWENEVRVSTAIDAAGRAVVEIADTGGGISQELAARVFDPFFTTKPAGVGTGLGLAICQRLVTAFGGEITFAPAPGGGTVFRVALRPAGASEAAASPSTSARRPRGRVLVVDDEPALLRSLSALLVREHDVVTASSGRAAMELLRTDRAFDAILTDIVMPELTGMDLYEAIRDTYPGFERRIVFMTGGVGTDRGRDFLARVPNRRVEKPFRTSELFAMLGELVGTA